MSKKKRFSFLTIAALALAMIGFSGCDTAITDGSSNPALELDVSRSVGSVQADLTGTKWLGNIDDKYGVALIEFTSKTTATATFGTDVHQFEYNLIAPYLNQYSLVEPTTQYKWAFGITGNTLTFSGTFKPYSQNPGPFRSISFQAPADLTNLAGTNWLGLGPRGESLLNNITATGAGAYTLTGTFGPDQPGEFHITGYSYSGGTSGTGGGTMDRGAGDFTAIGATATLTFLNFWQHEVEVVFYKFIYN